LKRYVLPTLVVDVAHRVGQWHAVTIEHVVNLAASSVNRLEKCVRSNSTQLPSTWNAAALNTGNGSRVASIVIDDPIEYFSVRTPYFALGRLRMYSYQHVFANSFRDAHPRPVPFLDASRDRAGVILGTESVSF
jgi:hypothetical protein